MNKIKTNKALIITLYGNNNFGNKLQNYALQRSIEKYGYDVETLKCKYRYANLPKNIKIAIGDTIKGIINFKKEHKRIEKFKYFNKKYIKYKKNAANTNDIIKRQIQGYDKYIYGSDQIWNPSCFGNSQLFLGYKTEKERNFSYAASFGISELPSNLKDFYMNGINNFNSISVREIAGANIIKKLNNIDVKVVMDPTLLLTECEWNTIINKPINYSNEKYILTYFLGKISEKQNDAIKKFATENNCKIINIMDKNSDFYNIGPSEFLYLIKNSFLVCTDSFHSCVFSFIFDKPFVIFKRIQASGKSMYSRIDSLLEIYKLENREFNDINITENNLNNNYLKSYEILKRERENSLLYLKNSLGIDTGETK